MNSGKTAIARQRESVPTRAILARGGFNGRILDYGCGKGKDVEFLENEGYDVVGYDPNHRQIEIPSIKFDTVICNYVFNVITKKADRIQLMSTLLKYLKPGGRLYISARNPKEIMKVASAGNWTKKGDGWITGKKTFQAGISTSDLLSYKNETSHEKSLKHLAEFENSKYTMLALES